jgi:hypothetical protein
VISVVNLSLYPGTLIELNAQGLERGRDGGEVRIMTYKRAGSILWYLGRNATSMSVICINGH